jgi:hypothetical protein
VRPQRLCPTTKKPAGHTWVSTIRAAHGYWHQHEYVAGIRETKNMRLAKEKYEAYKKNLRLTKI